MKEISTYYLSQFQNFEESFNKVIYGYEEGDIHKMRVAYKKIKALYFFVKNDLNDIKAFSQQIEEYKSIYKPAGIIREIQVNKMLLRTINKEAGFQIHDYLEYLNEKESNAINTLRESLGNNNVTGLKSGVHRVYNQIHNIGDANLIKRKISFINKKVKLIEELVYGDYKGEKYHAIRKCIKEAFFILSLMEKKQKLKDFNLNLKQLKKLSEKLGKWHDLDILKSDIESYIDFRKNQEESFKDDAYLQLIKLINRRHNKGIQKIDLKISKLNLKMLYYNGLEKIQMASMDLK